MKLIRFGGPGKEKPGILDSAGKRKDLSSIFKDWDREFFRKNGLSELKGLKNVSSLPDVPEKVRWGACVARPGKVLCIGLIYSDHAAESGMPVPAEPIVFQKGANKEMGPFDPVLIPGKTKKKAWDTELVLGF